VLSRGCVGFFAKSDGSAFPVSLAHTSVKQAWYNKGLKLLGNLSLGHCCAGLDDWGSVSGTLLTTEGGGLYAEFAVSADMCGHRCGE
jgi:hypothetical protein